MAVPLRAQSAGTVELGIFGKWTRFGDPLALDILHKLPSDNGFGGGVRGGIFFARHLEVEGDVSTTTVDAAGGGRVRYMPVHAGLTYNFPLGGSSHFLLGGRYVYNSYGEDAHFHDHGFGGVAGFRFGPVRIEGTADWMSSDDLSHGNYHNLGVDAGLSLLLGKHCNKAADGVTIAPSSATIERGERTTFTATALHCGKPREVVWTATGGTITATGEYTAGQTPGSYQVIATEVKEGAMASASVMIKAPPPPPPPPPPPITVTRIDLRPAHARLKVNESATFSVMGTMSDGSNRALNACPLTATGNPTRSGNSFSWGRYGAYTVTATCEGSTAESSVEVPLEIVIYGANFAFNKDQLTRAGLDSVRAATDSLKLYPEIKVRVAGFADLVGSDAYNCNLSWRRAQTVRRALNQFGIGDERISAVEGFGHAYPLPDDRVPQAWKDLNVQTHDKGKWWDRRVDITSATKDAGMMACAEPTGATNRKP